LVTTSQVGKWYREWEEKQ